MSELLNKVRVGIIGVGRMGEFHLRKALEHPSVEVVGGFEVRSESIANLRLRHGIRVFSTMEELLFESDAVVVASPTVTHFEIAKKALQSGAHVLVEKPMTETIAQAEELTKLAADTGLVLQVGFVERFRFSLLTKNLNLSKLRLIETDRVTTSLGREPESIDVVSDLMIHDLDIVSSLVKKPVVRSHANGVAISTKRWDVASATMEFEGGITANLHASRVGPAGIRIIRLYADDAIHVIDLSTNTVESHVAAQNGTFLKIRTEMPALDALREQFAGFIASVIEKTPPKVLAEEGMQMLSLIQNLTRKESIPRDDQEKALT